MQMSVLVIVNGTIEAVQVLTIFWHPNIVFKMFRLYIN